VNARTSVDPIPGREREHAVGRGQTIAALRAAPAVAKSPRRSWTRRYARMLVVADVTAALIATAVAYGTRPPIHLHSVNVVGWRVGYPTLGVLSVVAWMSTLAVSGAYRGKHLAGDQRDYGVPMLSGLRLMAVVAVCSYGLHANLSRLIVLVYFPTLMGSDLLTRGVVNGGLQTARRHGRGTVRLLLVGDSRAVREFADHIFAGPDASCEVVGVCTISESRAITVRGRSLRVVGRPDDMVAAARDLGADAVAVTNPACFAELSLQRAAWNLERSGVDLLVAPDVVAVAGPRIRVASIKGLPLLHISEPRTESLLRTVHSHAYRLLALPLTLLSAPLLLAIGLAVRLDSSGSVLYRQVRVGYRGREFEMLKFRTMVDGADRMLPDLLERNEHDGALFKIRNDPRVTRTGRFLRRHSLDELPQLLNVLKGDMLLVGPRPCLPPEMVKFGEPEQRRFLVKPGMTGLWQVSGRSDLAWEDAVKIDLYYVDNWSPALDASILGRTLKVVAGGKGC
jgi:exopolysaccharide biosynthesis polyprenyl glycosylphosphotransferase